MVSRSRLVRLVMVTFALQFSNGAMAQSVITPPAMVPVIPTPEHTVTMGSVTSFTMGGSEPAAKEREFFVNLAPGQSVIVDLVPFEASSVARRSPLLGAPSRPPLFGVPSRPGAVPGLTTGAVAELAIDGPDGVGLKHVSSRDYGPGGSISSASIEGKVGDYGVRIALLPVTSGIYRLVTRYNSMTEKRFDLLVRPRDIPKPQIAEPIAFGDERSGSVDQGQAMPYEFTVTDPSKWVMIEMISTEIDSIVDLRGPGDISAPRIDSDDDGGTGRNSCLLMKLAAGRYVIVARSMSGSGRYRLRLAYYEPVALTPRPLVAGIERKANFSGSDEGLLLGETKGAFHLYGLPGKAGQRFTVTMKSDAEDIDPILQAGIPALIIDDAPTAHSDLAIVAENDDAEDLGFNARIQIRFESDAIAYIRAGASNKLKPRGAYTIHVEEQTSAPR